MHPRIPPPGFSYLVEARPADGSGQVVQKLDWQAAKTSGVSRGDGEDQREAGECAQLEKLLGGCLSALGG